MRRALTSAIAGALLCAGALTACGEEQEQASDDAGARRGDAACQYPSDGQPPARPVEPPSESPVRDGEVPFTLQTSVGELSGVLDAGAAPCTVDTIASLAEQGWYDDTICHRLTTAGIFVLQCGDPTGSGRGGPGFTIPDELTGEETYTSGVLAMANTGQPDSGGSQFFLVYEDSELDPAYTVFGTLDDEGLATLREVAAAGVRGGGTDGAPATEVRIDTLTIG